MPIRSINISTSKRPISWGLQGENNATQLIIDVKDFYSAWPDGTPALCITRQDGHPYLAATQQWTLDTTTTDITFNLSSVETELPGRIKLTISWSLPNGSIAKTKSFLGFISEDSIPLPLTPAAITALDNLDKAVEKAEAAAETAASYCADEDGMSATKVLTATKLPSSGQKNRFYIDKSTSKVWIWDDNFIQIGTFGDNETITLNAAGDLCLKNWNLEYYKWIENPPQYKKQTTGPWPTNLELRSTANSIAWF